jgi:hypothetical protein
MAQGPFLSAINQEPTYTPNRDVERQFVRYSRRVQDFSVRPNRRLWDVDLGFIIDWRLRSLQFAPTFLRLERLFGTHTTVSHQSMTIMPSDGIVWAARHFGFANNRISQAAHSHYELDRGARLVVHSNFGSSAHSITQMPGYYFCTILVTGPFHSRFSSQTQMFFCPQ